MAEVKVPFYGHVRQYHNLKADIDKAMLDVLEGGVYTMGPALKRFEEELASYMGMKHAIGLNSGTDALWLAFLALGLGEGDEIITTSNTFFATAEAIWLIGATPVLVDCDEYRNIDVDKIEEKITWRTRAIVPVHLYGQPAQMRRVREIADKYNLYVIEDCAQALGSAGPDFKVGELSDAVATSFITAKNLGTFGDGGAVITNNDDIIEPIMKMRNHGSNKRSHHSVGWNSRLDDLHAGILSVKLKHIDEFNDGRIARAQQYDELLKGVKHIRLPKKMAGYRHIYHLYVVETPNRDDLQEFLKEKGIIALTNYPIAIHQQEGYPFGSGDPCPVLPKTEENAANCLSLPIYPELTADECKFVAESVLEWDAKQ